MSETLDAAERYKLAASVLHEVFGNCDDAEFDIGCVCCQASHVRRTLLEEPTPVADAAYQRAMAAGI